MAISVTDHFNLDKGKYENAGAFDSILDVDSLYFIDPRLLEECDIEEFKNSYKKLTDNFINIFKLLSACQTEGDKLWKEAMDRLPGGELKGINLGYSGNTDGSGLGPQHRREILRSAKIVADLGVQDPTFFELVGVFEMGIGADRISDMVSLIIKDDIIAYSKRVFQEFDISEHTTFRHVNYPLPSNPVTGEPIILVPKVILSELPVADSWDEIDIVCATNQELRNEVNGIIGDTWKTASKRKEALKEQILTHADLVKDLIASYDSKSPTPYNFAEDKNGESIWYEQAKSITEKHPLKLDNTSINDINDVVECVRTILARFKDLVENNGLYELLYRDNACTKPKHERAAQKLLYGIAHEYCVINNVDISPEVNAGRGSVDFKFSRGYDARIIVELKRTSSSALVHGYETQLEEYRKAEKVSPNHCFYVPIGINDNCETRFKLVAQKQGEMIRDGVVDFPEIINIDARRKNSASVFKFN